MKNIIYTCDNCNKQIPCGNRYFMINVIEMHNNPSKQILSSKRMYHLCCDCFYSKKEALGIEPDEIYNQ